MPKFRKLPVEIEAMQFTGDAAAVNVWMDSLGVPEDDDIGPDQMGWWETDDGIVIGTLEGDLLASPGDWIIRGVQGEFYPCKNEIFETTYEPVPEKGSYP